MFRVRVFGAWALALAVLFLALSSLGREVPSLGARVNDTAGMLSAEARERLEQQLAQYEQRTQSQFALLTIDTLDGDSLEDFSIRIVESWKLGRKGKDDGLLLLVVRDDHKVRIEVGYGLEGVITDVVSARVLREVLRPAFRSGDYEGGIVRTFEQLMRIVSGEVPAEPQATGDPGSRQRKASGKPILALVALALFFVFPFLGPRRFSRRGGSSWGGPIGRRGSRGIFWGGGLGGGLGGGGGFGRGGGFGGGGFGGGGGGFGGGGASGSW